MRFSLPVTNITKTANPLSTTISQGLYCEHVEVQSRQAADTGEALLVRNWRDEYEGFVPASCLLASDALSTHFVATASTLLFSRPDIKSAAPLRLVYGSELVIKSQYDQQFNVTDTGGYVLRDHCMQMGATIGRDFVTTAEEHFLGVPYLWGGRSVNGFDCSGLIQMSAFSVGVLLPRDSGMQEAFLTTDVLQNERRRADFVFWPGHVGMMVNEQDMLHATAHGMLSVVEPLAQVVERAGAVSAIKRL